MGMVQITVIAVSCVSKVIINRAARKKIKCLVEYSEACEVKRDGSFKTLKTDELVPGNSL
jgi:magnesium-transporting ATPase (P-type)